MSNQQNTGRHVVRLPKETVLKHLSIIAGQHEHNARHATIILEASESTDPRLLEAVAGDRANLLEIAQSVRQAMTAVESLESLEAGAASLRSTLETVRFQLGGPCNITEDVSDEAMRYNARNAIQTIRQALSSTTAGLSLLQEIQSLGEQVEQKVKEANNSAATFHESEYRVRQLRETLAASNLAALETGGYWAWDPGGENHLESLSCPVVIPAEWLRNLLQEAEERGASAALERLNKEEKASG